MNAQRAFSSYAWHLFLEIQVPNCHGRDFMPPNSFLKQHTDCGRWSVFTRAAQSFQRWASAFKSERAMGNLLGALVI